MAWTIHSWSVERGSGTIASPHYGPVPFDSKANVDNVQDFQIGEPVLVELDGRGPDFEVLSIRPLHQRQPEGTHWPDFEAVNGRFSDFRIEEQSSHTVQFWVGECCEWCTPNAPRVRFDGVTTMIDLGDDADFSAPLFRLASADEIRTHSLSVPSGARAFCIVTSHGQGRDGPPIFIVASSARIVRSHS
jgi:hypothetical protein